MPYDRGAHWVYLPDSNPITKATTPHRGLDIYPAPQSEKVRVGRRFARAGEPKKLVMLSGFGHYEVYSGDAFRQVMEPTVAWYRQHIPPK